MEEILANELDPHFKEEVAQEIGLKTIKGCFTCGSCTGVCPVHEVVEEFDPRLIIHMILLGLRKEVLSSDLIWFCCLCNSCFSVCPQGIKFSRIATELQKMAITEGYGEGKFLKRLEVIRPYLQDLCRRTMFLKVREGFRGLHTMPCWRRETKKNPPSPLFEKGGLGGFSGKKIDLVLEKYGYRDDALIGMMQEIQRLENYLPPEVLRYLSCKLRVPLSRIHHIATFYKSFSLKPRGRHIIRVCLGTACHLNGAMQNMEQFERMLHIPSGETTPDRMFSLETVNCLGTCALAPVTVVDETYYEATTPAKVEKILSGYRGEAGTNGETD